MIEDAVAAIRRGEILGLPTDTVYGVGVDPINLDAMGRLFDLKGRPDHKPVGVLVATLGQALEIVEMSDYARLLATQHWPGALTLVVTPKVIISDWVGHRQRRTIGVRVPDHPTALELLTASGPLAVTSANLSGAPETMNDIDARAVFGDRVAVYLPGTAPGGMASTVVDVSGVTPTVLREGPISI